MRRKQSLGWGLVALALSLIIIALLIEVQFTGMTMLTAQQINVNSQGYESGGKVKGTFWSILMSASYNDQVSFYQFDDSDVPTGLTWNGKDVEVKNRIKIEIDPSRPYYERSIVKKSYQITPKAYRNYVGPSRLVYGRDEGVNEVPALMSDVYETSTSTWELHTPFTLRVYKNDVLVGTQTLDLFASGIAPNINVALNGKDVKIGTTSDYVMFESLGALLGGYESPNWASVIGWSNQYLYLNSPTIQKALHNPYPIGDGQTESTTWMNAVDYQGTYAWYWYGKEDPDMHWNWYWRDDGTPCPIQAGVGYGTIVQTAGQVRGWKQDPNPPVTYTRVNPIKPVLFPSQEVGSDYTGKYSVTEFLDIRGAQKIATGSLMPSWEPNPSNIHVDDPKGQLRIYLPYQSYNPLFVIRISSELADTVIWEPLVSNIKFIEVNGRTDTTAEVEIDLGEIADRKSVSFKVRNEGNIAASGTVSVQPIDQNVSWAFEPRAQGTGTMQPGEEKVFTFDVVDLTTTEKGTFKFKAIITNVLGAITDSRTFKATLLPRGVGGVLLYVRAVDKNSTLDVAGHRIVLTFNDATQSREAFTPSTFDFEGATPYVTVTAPETLKYKAASQSKQLEVGLNTITLELEPIGYVPPPGGFDWTWIIVGVIFAVAAVVMVFLYSKNSRLRGRRASVGKKQRSSPLDRGGSGGSKKW
jgi:hypothetical protein